MLAIAVLAIAVALDATAVAAARAVRGVHRADVIAMAIVFGGFQAGFAAAGWAGGATIAPYIEVWDHWLAFGVLAALGAKMVIDGFRGDGDEAGDDEPVRLTAGALLLLGVATSIDAAATGVTLPVVTPYPGVAIAAFGVVTAALTLAGGFGGRALGARGGERLGIVGGLALIAIGVNILFDHL